MQPPEQLKSTYRTDVIRAEMARLQLTNELLAEKTGLSAGTISAVRNGSKRVMLSSLVAIAAALDIELQRLFEPKAA